jgi:3-methyl-2-oxobutanoate hydroxymethyltransferase
MTSHPTGPVSKLSLLDLAERKANGEKLVMVTAYDHPGAKLADAAGVDLILVGDSAADNVLGYDSTVPVTVDELLVLVRAVARGAERPLVIADMPFGSFQVSNEAKGMSAICPSARSRSRTRLPSPTGSGS